MADFEKIVLITKKTALEELIERFNTKEQARFYIEHMGASFNEYEDSYNKYIKSLEKLKEKLPKTMPCQFIERSFLPTFTFGDKDLVITLGPDGLVVNAAKYLSGQKLLAFNPDPARIDGILVPFQVSMCDFILAEILRNRLHIKSISMAKAELNDGQTLYALNDLFIGHQSHVSARYHLSYKKRGEDQSSSGIIVSTGAGSTGWFRAILTGAAGITGAFSKQKDLNHIKEKYRFDWEADYLYFSVREPFISKYSSAEMVFGKIEGGEYLEIISYMPQKGVIFSDGIESDYMEFNSGSIAKIRLAEKKLNLFVK
jgi:NAD kinase